MTESKINAVSGVPEGLLGLIVYSFFPLSHRFSNNACFQIRSNYIVNNPNDVEVIVTGSGPEYLMLPPLLRTLESNGKKKFTLLYPDVDMMINNHMLQFLYGTMSVETDKDRPLFYRIKQESAKYLF